MAVTDEGEVYSWGFGGMGRLGVGDTGHRWSPTLVLFGPEKQIELVAAGKAHTAAVGQDGSLYTWVRTCFFVHYSLARRARSAAVLSSKPIHILRFDVC